MSVLQFDSLEYAQELQKSGLTREQAEGLARVNTRAFQALLDTKELATRQDILNLKQEISRLEQATKQDFARLEQTISQNRHDLEILIYYKK